MSTFEFENEGALCLADEVGVIKVRPDYCMSSSCDTLIEASCTATLEGYTLTVQSHAKIEHVGEVCTADCGLVEASCTFDVIQDAEGITVVHGENSIHYDALPRCSTL